MIYALEERRVETRGEYYVAPNAVVIGSVVLERNASVWFNCVVRGDNDLITIGENCNVQDGSVLHTDDGIRLTLERNVSVGHMAMLHGCTVREGSLVGIGAVILNNAVIGRECLIGARAFVAEGKEIPDRSLVLGTPGRVVRTLGDEEVAGIARIAEHYAARGRQYRTGLVPQDGL